MPEPTKWPSRHLERCSDSGRQCCCSGRGFPQTMPWLVGFVALTIGGERVELARVGSPDPRLRQAATYLSVGVALSAGLALTLPATGVRVFAVLTLALVGVLVTFDVARKTIRMTGLPRFSAACILTGYFWLALAATTWLWAGPLLEGPGYDLVTHSVFLGFALSMVMGHAPIIFPAVVRRPIPYHWSMWAAFILLQVSLFARLVLGDLREVPWTWQVGGALNVARHRCVSARHSDPGGEDDPGSLASGDRQSRTGVAGRVRRHRAAAAQSSRLGLADGARDATGGQQPTQSSSGPRISVARSLDCPTSPIAATRSHG